MCVVYFKTLSITIVLNGRMNDELEMIWKEAAAASSRHYPAICLERMRKTTHNKKLSE
jgi:hypothetical protein